jgi:hypothetical protein
VSGIPCWGRRRQPSFLYVLRRRGLAIYDTSLCEVGQLEIEGRSLALAGPALAVARGDDVVFDITDSCNPRPSHSLDVCTSASLFTPSICGGRAVIGVSQPEGDRLLRITHAPFEAVRFNGPAWYANSAQIGRISASFDEHRMSVVVHSIVRSARF